MIAAARVTAVILTAGASSRMGRTKALLPLREPWGAPQGECAIARIGRLSGPVGRRVVVVGPDSAEIRAVVGAFADVAINADPTRGMFSSVQVGLEVALSTTATPDAVLMWPVDVPLVAPETVLSVLGGGAGGPDAVWATVPALISDMASTGHPILISRGLARKILAEPDSGRLDRCLEAEGVVVEKVVVQDRLMLVDLDTPEVARTFVIEGVFSA